MTERDGEQHDQVEESVLSSPRFLERVIESMPVGLLVKDPRDRFRHKRINAHSEELFGIRRADVVGKLDYDLFDEELADGYRLDDEQVFADGVTRVIHEKVETYRGLRAVRTIKIPLFDAQGRPEALLGFLQDMQDYEDAVEAADEANALKTRFLANMSHEMRTPLYGVLGMLDIALSADDAAERDHALATARDSADSLLALINDVLDLAKVESGKMDIVCQPFSLDAVVLASCAAMSGYQEGRRISVEHRGAQPKTPRRLLGDAARIQQILTNLLSNALKFSEPEMPVNVVVTRSRTHQASTTECVVFEVIDRGCGIGEEDAETIFASFRQVPSQQDAKRRGTGLGLAIVRELAELMGGTCGVSSVLGHGSTFRVEIPFDCELGAAVPVEDATDAASTERELRPGHVLVAEDERVNQMIVQRMLERAGHTVEVVENGAEALERVSADSSSYDFVLMDVRMPVMDGHEAVREIRRLEGERSSDPAAERTPIICCTANAMRGDDQLCYEAGADGYLAKPLNAEQLRGAMLQVDRRPL